MLKKSILPFLVPFGALPAFATVSSVEILGASNVVASGGITYVYGGLAGDETNCDATDGETTCDSCSGVATIAVCNQKRIYDSLMLRVQFKTDNSAAITTSSKLEVQVNGTTANLAVDSDTSSSTIATDTTLTAAISWSDLCIGMGMVGGCTEDQTSPITVKFGINADSDTELEEAVEVKVQVTGKFANDNPADYTYHTAACGTNGVPSSRYEGFCDFKVFKGDKKVYIEDETSDDSYNSTGMGTTYRYVRFYFEPDTDTTCADSEFQTVTVNSAYIDVNTTEEEDSYFLQTRTLKGLTNGVGYYFRMANVDIAGNIFYFSEDDANGIASQYLTCTDNQHYTIPEKVIGLLNEKSCFIATAAFGSSLAPEIQTLRAFRDKFLLTNAIGRWFTKKYYELSPDLAQWIKQHSWFKKATQVALWPVVAISSMTLILGSGVTFSIFLGFMLSIAIMMYTFRRGRNVSK